jgi:DNA-binding MarR family transcriptional regulator
MSGDHSTNQAKSFNDAWTAIGTVLFIDAKPHEGLGVTDGQLLVLYTLDALGPLRVGQLAVATGMLSPGLSRMISAMQRRGLVARSPDAEDRRASVVSLAMDGRSIVDRHKGRLVAATARMLDALAPSEREEVVASAERIRELLAPIRSVG